VTVSATNAPTGSIVGYPHGMLARWAIEDDRHGITFGMAPIANRRAMALAIELRKLIDYPIVASNGKQNPD
jgi:hypothetical protein